MRTSKTCPHCKTEKLMECYYQHGRGFSAWCKDCIRARSRAQAEAGYFRARRRAKRGDKPGPRRLSPIERVAADSFHNARKHALRLGREFDLTREFVERLFSEFCSKHYHSTDPRSPFRPSLDRIDDRTGYLQSNVRCVWVIENLARNRWTDKDVIEFCKRKLEII